MIITTKITQVIKDKNQLNDWFAMMQAENFIPVEILKELSKNKKAVWKTGNARAIYEITDE